MRDELRRRVVENELLTDEEIDEAVCSVYRPCWTEGEEVKVAQGSIEGQYRHAQRVAVAEAQVKKILRAFK